MVHITWLSDTPEKEHIDTGDRLEFSNADHRKPYSGGRYSILI